MGRRVYCRVKHGEYVGGLGTWLAQLGNGGREAGCESISSEMRPDVCQGTCLPDAECQTSARAYAFQTQSVKAFSFQTQSVKAFAFVALPIHISSHAAPNSMRLRVCVLDEDGHRISLPRDKCQSVAPPSER
jgi:hypothetical protein